MGTPAISLVANQFGWSAGFLQAALDSIHSTIFTMQRISACLFSLAAAATVAAPSALAQVPLDYEFTNDIKGIQAPKLPGGLYGCHYGFFRVLAPYPGSQDPAVDADGILRAYGYAPGNRQHISNLARRVCGYHAARGKLINRQIPADADGKKFAVMLNDLLLNGSFGSRNPGAPTIESLR
jgi:hypothetical protein